MDKIDRINKDPEPIQEKEDEKEKIQEKEEEINTQNKFEKGRHISKYIVEEEEGTTSVKKVVTQEVHVTKQVTVIKKGEIKTDVKIEEKYKKISGIDDAGEDNIQEPENEEEKVNGRYGGIAEGNEEHKKEYDDWFTRHSMDKQVIDYKPEKEKMDEKLKRNEMGYGTWFKNHSQGSFEQSQSGDLQKDEPVKTKFEYSEWFSNHSKDKMVIEYKREKKKSEDAPARCEVDYPTWFENHSKLTNKSS